MTKSTANTVALNTANSAANLEAANNTGTETGQENGTETGGDVKQTRVTLISALLAKDVEGVAGVLLKQGRSLDEIKGFADTLKKAVPSFKTLLEAQEEQRKLDEIRKNEERKKEEEARSAAALLLEEAKQKAINDMVEKLKANGVSPEMALSVAQSTMGGGSSTRGSTAPKQRVKCIYNGKEFMVAVTGNNKDATKQAIAESGLEREAFIEKYKAA
jgi:hypothetical protein